MNGAIPYAKPYWTDEETAAVTAVIESGMWSSGAVVERFERTLGGLLAGAEVVCMSSGTSAIHALLQLLADRAARRLVVTSTLNFAAVAASARQLGYDVALTDIDPKTLAMSATSLDLTLSRLKGDYDQLLVFPVHYAGVAADLAGLLEVCARHGAVLAEDACQAIGGEYQEGGPVGSCQDSIAAAFSFHPTKPVSAGEGGALATRDADLAARLRLLRNHNMVRDRLADAPGYPAGPWAYDIREPGSNLRMSDLHAAIGLVQLRRLPHSLAVRRSLARRYIAELTGLPAVRLPQAGMVERSALHLFPVEFDTVALGMTKDDIFTFFDSRGIKLQLHYRPSHTMTAFAGLPTVRGCQFPVADAACERLFSIPLFLGLTEQMQDSVIETITELSSRARD